MTSRACPRHSDFLQPCETVRHSVGSAAMNCTNPLSLNPRLHHHTEMLPSSTTLLECLPRLSHSGFPLAWTTALSASVLCILSLSRFSSACSTLLHSESARVFKLLLGQNSRAEQKTAAKPVLSLLLPVFSCIYSSAPTIARTSLSFSKLVAFWGGSPVRQVHSLPQYMIVSFLSQYKSHLPRNTA